MVAKGFIPRSFVVSIQRQNEAFPVFHQADRCSSKYPLVLYAAYICLADVDILWRPHVIDDRAIVLPKGWIASGYHIRDKRRRIMEQVV